MRGIVHPFSQALYEQDGAGNIRVTQGGRSGTFAVDGREMRFPQSSGAAAISGQRD